MPRGLMNKVRAAFGIDRALTAILLVALTLFEVIRRVGILALGSLAQTLTFRDLPGEKSHLRSGAP